MMSTGRIVAVHANVITAPEPYLPAETRSEARTFTLPRAAPC